MAERKNTKGDKVNQLYKALGRTPSLTGYLSKTALIQVAQELKVNSKGSYFSLSMRILKALEIAYTSDDHKKDGKMHSRVTKVMVDRFLEWKDAEDVKREASRLRGETMQKVHGLNYRTCNRMSLKKAMCTLVGESYFPSMGTRPSDFYLNNPILREMTRLTGQEVGGGDTNYSLITNLLHELGEMSTDVPYGARAGVEIYERVAFAFLENADAFMDDISLEMLSQVTLEPRVITPIPQSDADELEKSAKLFTPPVPKIEVITKQPEVVAKPEEVKVEDEEFKVNLGAVNLLNFMKGGGIANLSKAFESCCEIGEVTKCELADGGRKIIIEIDLGGQNG